MLWKKTSVLQQCCKEGSIPSYSVIGILGNSYITHSVVQRPMLAIGKRKLHECA
nr:MAG TPA: hypothetical protein [Caudoviricetes sp.]